MILLRNNEPNGSGAGPDGLNSIFRYPGEIRPAGGVAGGLMRRALERRRNRGQCADLLADGEPRRPAAAVTFAPMEAKLVADLPAGPGWRFEPKWGWVPLPGVRGGDEIDLRAKSGKPLARYFPDVVAALKALPCAASSSTAN